MRQGLRSSRITSLFPVVGFNSESVISKQLEAWATYGRSLLAIAVILSSGHTVRLWRGRDPRSFAAKSGTSRPIHPVTPCVQPDCPNYAHAYPSASPLPP